MQIAAVIAASSRLFTTSAPSREIGANSPPCFRSGARQAKRRGQIHLQHRIPIGITHAQRQHIAREAGIIHQNIQAPGLSLDFLNKLRRRLRVRQISGRYNDPRAKLSGECFQFRSAAAGNGNRRTLGVQRAGHTSADAARGASDKGSLAGQIKHISHPWLKRLNRKCRAWPGG
jgi:hypothetical protein